MEDKTAKTRFLPTTRQEMDRLGWNELDVLLITGDAYVDHPTFGAPLLGRWLERHGFRVGICAQPRWDVPDDVSRMGRPRLFAGVSAGNLDSMLAHYTAFRKKRSDDAFTPGGKAGARPNRATIVYTNLARRAFPGLPVVLGGIEASLRRISHYDFWTDALRRSILWDSKADAVLYGMAETAVLALARGLEGVEPGDKKGTHAVLASLPGTAYAGKAGELPPDAEIIHLPSHEDMLGDPGLLIRATKLLERHVHQDKARAVQPGPGRDLILTPPGPGLDGKDLDVLAALPFTRRAHPSYKEPVPAEGMIHSSITTHRGCAGGCSFCALALHQGRRLRSRSRQSVLDEVKTLAGLPGFKGSITDVGGPSANMWGARCQADPAKCARPSCLTPEICPHFSMDHGAFVDLLRDVREVPGVRHVRVASGWRMDLALQDKPSLGRLIREFVGGQVKVAPEHGHDKVLELMRKPKFEVFERFLEVFERESKKAGKRQFVIPYLMSAHPGCTVERMRHLGAWLRGKGWKPKQVQCFIPLPGTASAAMYYAGTDMKGRPIPVDRTDAGRLAQHAVLIPETGRGKKGKRPGGKRRRKRG